jgi:hypothetical protein
MLSCILMQVSSSLVGERFECGLLVGAFMLSRRFADSDQGGFEELVSCSTFSRNKLLLVVSLPVTQTGG